MLIFENFPQKMKIIKSLLLLAVMLNVFIFDLGYAREIAKPQGCYDEDTKQFWPVGESYNPIGQCISMNCMSEDGVFDAISCAPYVPAESGCEVIDEDLTKPYPECCATMKCTEKTKENEIATETERIYEQY